MKILFIEFNIQDSNFPLGFKYIKKYTTQFHKDLDITIKQFSYGKRFSYEVNANLELKVLAFISKLKPDIVAFSSYIWSSNIIDNIIRGIKLSLPDISILVGGVEINYDNSEFAADYLIQGEGELAFKRFIDYKKGNLSIEEVPSLIYKKNGKLVKNKVQIIENLDELPFPYDGKGYYPSIKIESTRGCIFNCNYCYYAQRKVRSFSMRYMKKAINKLFNNYTFDNLTFLDANFNVKEERMFQLLDIVQKYANKELKIHLEFKPELLNEASIKKLSQYNFHIFLEMGLQSSDKEVLKECNRPYDINKIRNNLNLLNISKISYNIDLMYGLPKDNFMKFINSAKFIINNATKQNNLRAHHFMLLNGTTFYNNNKIIRFDKNNSSMVIKTPSQDVYELYKTKLFIDTINKELKNY